MERLDPARSEVAHRIPTATGPRAARRLLPPIQSTSTAAHRPNSAEHHRRRPRRRSSFSCDALSDVIAKLRMATLLSERSQPRCHGSGDSGASNARVVHFRHRDRSRYRLCPNPIGSDTSCRIARRVRIGDILARGAPRPIMGESTVRVLPSTPLWAASFLGPPHAFPREGERGPPHPRCLPSSDGPHWGPPTLSTICAQAVECWADAFLRSSRRPCL